MSGHKRDSQHHTGASLFRGAALLGAAALGSKLLGTLQKIPLQNIGGDAVFGIYSAVYQMYAFVLALVFAGIPIAMSKLVSEQSALGNDQVVRALLRGGLRLYLPVGAGCFAIFYFGAPQLASLIGIGQAEAAFRSVSFVFWFVPPLALMRGYMQGLHNMAPTAVSQLTEQLVRVATMIALTLSLTAAGAGYSALSAGAAFGSVTGAAAGAIVMTAYFVLRRNKTMRRSDAAVAGTAPGSGMAKRLAAYATPVSLGALSVPLFTIVDTLSVPRLLQISGLPETAAAHAFGVYNHGLPLVQLVIMFAAAMASAIVPYIADANINGHSDRIRTYTELALRYTWLVGLAAAAGLALTAKPVSVMLYKSAEGWETIAILAVTAWFGTLTTVAASILQGLGLAGVTVRSMLLATIVKIGCNFSLVQLWGIDGAALSAVIAFAVAGLVNVWALRKRTGVSLSFSSFLLRPFLAVLLMGVFVWFTMKISRFLLEQGGTVQDRLHDTIVALAAVGGGALIYGLLLIRLGCTTERDINLIPKYGDRLARLLRKYRILS